MSKPTTFRRFSPQVHKPKKMRASFENKFKESLEASGIKEWEYEPDSILWQPAVAKYIPDFKLYRPDGSFFYIETKGYFTASERMRFLTLKKQHPELDIRLVFQRDNRLNPKSPTTYTMWAKKYGFPCSVGANIPTEWVSECQTKQ